MHNFMNKYTKLEKNTYLYSYDKIAVFIACCTYYCIVFYGQNMTVISFLNITNMIVLNIFIKKFQEMNIITEK